MADFNAQPAAFTGHKKERKDKDYLSFDMRLVKVVKPVRKGPGYVVSGIGLAYW